MAGLSTGSFVDCLQAVHEWFMSIDARVSRFVVDSPCRSGVAVRAWRFAPITPLCTGDDSSSSGATITWTRRVCDLPGGIRLRRFGIPNRPWSRFPCSDRAQDEELVLFEGSGVHGQQ